MKIQQILDLIKRTSFRQLLKIRKFNKDTIKYARSYMTTYSLCSLLNIGFIDELNKTGFIDSKSFAKTNNLNEEILISVCEYLYTIKILSKKSNKYSLTRQGKSLIKHSTGTFDFIYAYAPLFENLDSLLRNTKKYNENVFRRGDFVAKATAEVSQYIPIPIIKSIIEKYKFNSILDLGCGSVEFLIQLCQKVPLKALGIDVSKDAIEFAQENIKKHNLGKEIKVKVGDIFDLNDLKSVKESHSIDAITSMFVLHEFALKDNSKIIKLLNGIRKVFPESYLIICEFSRFSSDELRGKTTSIAEHHLFHALSQQGILTPTEWKNTFKQSGYNVVEEIRYDFAGQAYFILKC